MCQKCTTEEFIEKAIAVHGDKYDYSQVVYEGTHEKVEIICKEHDSFLMTPHNHLSGQGCKQCNSVFQYQKLSFSTLEIKKRIKKLFGNKFDLANVNYINMKTKIQLTCTDCNQTVFVRPESLLNGSVSCWCSPQYKGMSTDWFRWKMSKINTKIEIIGEYEGTSKNIQYKCECGNTAYAQPSNLLQGRKCSKCGNSEKLTQEEFENRIKLINPDIKILGEYKGLKTNIKYLCKCGDVKYSTPVSLLRGSLCKTCGETKRGLSQRISIDIIKSEVMQRGYTLINLQHKNHKYILTLQCQNSNHPQFIMSYDRFKRGQNCPYCHNKLCYENSLQSKNQKLASEWHPTKNRNITPENVTSGTNRKAYWLCPTCGKSYKASIHNRNHNGSGCPSCSELVGEKLTRKIFKKLFRHTFNKQRPDWLINPATNYPLELDGFNKKLGIAFEYNGKQHDQHVARYHGKKSKKAMKKLADQKYRDKVKRRLCKKNEVKLIVIPEFKYTTEEYALPIIIDLIKKAGIKIKNGKVII